MDELSPGAVIDGRYKVTGRLGGGGMGTVYQAVHLRMQRDVAIKVLAAGAEGPQLYERFVREARAACSLRHPNLVTYHDFGTDPATGLPYLVLELVMGRDLATELKRCCFLPLGRAIHVVAQVAGAVAEAHRCGVVHRDLKPANVMLSRVAGDPDFVTVIDFGIARLLDGPSELTRTITHGVVVGTPAYLSPEVLLHERAGPEADQYALGVIAYELLAGRRPFVGPDPRSVCAQHIGQVAEPLIEQPDGTPIAPALAQVVARTLRKDPAERFPDLLAFRAALLRFSPDGHAEPDAVGPTQPGLAAPQPTVVRRRPRPEPTADPPATTPPEGVTPFEQPPPTRRWWPLGLVAAAAATGLLVGAWLDRQPVALAPLPTLAWTVAAPAAPVRRPAPRRSVAGATVAQPRRAMAQVTRRLGVMSRRRTRAEPVADAPAYPVSERRVRRVPVTIVVRPFGEVRLRGRALGRDLVRTALSPGRHCFEVGRRRHCRRITAGGSNTFSLPAN